MRFNPNIHHRQSIRLKGYDYSGSGLYFITIRTNRKQLLFGEIVDGVNHKNGAGLMVEKWFGEMTRKFYSMDIDCKAIMPDHIHFIISLKSANANVPMYEMIQWFKTMTTNEYIRGVINGVYKAFDRKIWQRGYYDRIVWDDIELYEVRRYINDNPSAFHGGIPEWLKAHEEE